jgi:hypothetical protein
MRDDAGDDDDEARERTTTTTTTTTRPMERRKRRRGCGLGSSARAVTVLMVVGLVLATRTTTRGWGITAVWAMTPAVITAVMERDFTFFSDAAVAFDAEEMKALVNKQDGDTGYTPALVSAFRNDAEMLKTLLDMGADAEIEDFDGHTAMHAAAASGSVHAMRVLKEYGTSVETLGRDGFSPLHRASWGSPVATSIISILRVSLRYTERWIVKTTAWWRFCSNSEPIQISSISAATGC